MNLRDLKYLVAVADNLHFGKAADACHVSQPTLSMQVKKLEDYLGIPLFERTNKQVMVTAYGKEIVKLARNIVQQSDDLISFAKTCRDPLSGEFRLGAFPTIAPYLLPRIIPHIKETMPRLTMLLVEEKSPVLIEKLLNGQIDAAILALPVEQENFVSKALFNDDFRLAVPKSHRLAKNKSVTMEDIATESLLLLEDGHCLRNQALEVCFLSGAKETEGFRATSLETLRQMVMADSGITLIPQIAITDKNPAISYIPFKENPPSRTIGLVYRGSSTRVQVIEKIADIAKSLYRI